MAERGWSLGLTSLAALAAVAAIGSARSGAAPARPVDSSATATPSPPPASRADTGLSHGEDLLRQFFGSNLTDSRVAPRRYELKVLIATLPDPYDSHLDFVHDVNLEAIRRAFEASGFVADRFWFPTARDSLDLVRGRRTVRVARREVEPGAILFRNTDPALPRLRMLLLVPELPTQGIHKAAMLEALSQRERLLDYAEPGRAVDTADPIRIIGPSFSGSALSLQLVLRTWLAAPERRRQPVEIVSGTATSADNLETLNCPELGIHFRAPSTPMRAWSGCWTALRSDGWD